MFLTEAWLVEESPCQTNRNTLCRCQPGFTCKSPAKLPCEECEPTPTLTPTHPPTLTPKHPPTLTPTKWLFVSGCTLLVTALLLLMFLCYFLHLKIKCGTPLCKSTGHSGECSCTKQTHMYLVHCSLCSNWKILVGI